MVAVSNFREELVEVEHLEGGTLADVVHVLLVGEAVEAHAAVVGDAVRLHDLVDALQHKHGLVVVGLHALVNHLGQLGIVAHHVAGVHLLAELVVRGRHAHDIHVGLLILGGELDARLQGGLKQLVQSVLLKGSLARVEGYFLANFLATWRDK